MMYLPIGIAAINTIQDDSRSETKEITLQLTPQQTQQICYGVEEEVGFGIGLFVFLGFLFLVLIPICLILVMAFIDSRKGKKK